MRELAATALASLCVAAIPVALILAYVEGWVR